MGGAGAPAAARRVAIRRGGRADARALAEMRWRFRSGLAGAIEEREAFLARCGRWMERRLGARSRWRCWVAEVEGELVGHVWAQRIEKVPNPVDEPEEHAYLTNLFVAGDGRGEGIGGRLLEAAVAWCRERGVVVQFSARLSHEPRGHDTGAYGEVMTSQGFGLPSAGGSVRRGLGGALRGLGGALRRPEVAAAMALLAGGRAAPTAAQEVPALASVGELRAVAPLAGCWSGTILEGAERRRALLELWTVGGESWEGAIHLLAGDVGTDSLISIAVDGDSLVFAAPSLEGEPLFHGRLSPDGRALDGRVARGNVVRAFHFARAEGESPARGLLGFWNGTLMQSDAPVLRIVLRIGEAPCGEVLISVESPERGALELPVTGLVFAGDSLHLDLGSVGGAFDAVVAADGTRIAGRWTQEGVEMGLDLVRDDEPASVRRPQEPIRPFPYIEEEVSYENAADGVRLAGTLTLPRGEGPFPAVLLLSGSGPQDRNETLVGHRPFLVLADHLTRLGLAVLRVDDRGVGGSTGDILHATLEDNAEDALAGIALLGRHPRIARGRIGLIGHSEGGWLAPLVASRSRDVAFVVLLAGPGVNGEELLHAQNAALLRSQGASPELVAAQRAFFEAAFAAIRRNPSDEAARVALQEAGRRVRDSLPAGVAATLDTLGARLPPAAGTAGLETLLTPWFRHLLDYDPRPHLRRVRVPVLALIGAKDLQVPPERNLPELRGALEAGGNPDFAVHEVEGLNHLLQTAETGRIEEYGRIEETISPRALEIIGDWLLSRVGHAAAQRRDRGPPDAPAPR